MTSKEKASYIDFVNRSFRDIGDGDYLSARILYRFNLGMQFLWSAHQAVEKYLKAILLYNMESSKHIGHDLNKALCNVQKIRDIQFNIPENVKDFIIFLNVQGNNRYFDKPASATGEELLMLDQTVWRIRLYCQYMYGQSTPGPDGNRISLFPFKAAEIKAASAEKANKFSIHGGYLEKILDQKKSAIRKYLIWKNFYYGSYKKKVIKTFPAHSWSANPAHFLSPNLFSILENRVKFSKEIIDLFSRNN